MFENPYKLLRNALLYGVTALAMYGCGGNTTDNTSPSQQPPSPRYGDNHITSVYGTAKIEFPNGVVITEQQTTQGLTTQGSQGSVTVYLPHTGGHANLTVNNDSPATYIYMTSNGNNIYNNPSFSLGSSNLSWEQVSCDATDGNTYNNEFMIKFTHSSSQEIGTFNFNLQEGESITLDNLRLYDWISQGSSNVCDLGDYFDSFSVKANVMPQVNPVSTSSCPSMDLGNNNISVPYDATCVEFNIEDTDGVGSNHRYSLDGTNWVPVTLPARVQVDISSLPSGSSINLYVGETLSNGNESFEDVKDYLFTIYKDAQAGLNIYCNDGKTGNVWQVNNGETCEFTDPTQGSNAPYTHSINLTFNDGTTSNCRVEIYKNGTLVDQGTYPCNAVNHSYVLDNADTGTGQQQVDAKVYKDYGGNKVLIDAKTFYYKINKAPTFTSFFFNPATAKDGTQIYKYYVGENISGELQGNDVEGDALTCYLDQDRDGNFDQTLSNCQNPTSLNLSYNATGTYDPLVRVCDSLDCAETTFSQMNGGKTIGIYNQPSVNCYWDPEVTFVGVSSTLYINVNDSGITDDNGSGCEIRIDYLNDGYVGEVVNTCNSISRTFTFPVPQTRTDRVDFEDYRGTIITCYANLDVLPVP